MKPDLFQLQTFIQNHVNIIRPLNRSAALSYWEAAISGDKTLYRKAAASEFNIRQVYSNSRDFEYLRNLKSRGTVNEPLLNRQLELLYLDYLENQVPKSLLKEMVELGSRIENKFTTFRPNIDGQKVTDNIIDEILKGEVKSERRQKAWEAGKQVAPKVAEDIIRLVKLRNSAAQHLDFDNFHMMSFFLDELQLSEIDAIFNEIDHLTYQPFLRLKNELDKILAGIYGKTFDELMPWHYHDPFFQEAPLVYEVDLDKYYLGKQPESIASAYFKKIGLPVKSIIEKSDLYEKEGKNPHAFCTNIDREGDVRILCNLKDSERWMETTLHELGHAVYDKYHDPDLPYLLREPAHILTTEGMAMFFGCLSRDAEWMKEMLGLSDEAQNEIQKTSAKYARLKQLVFVRWALVMYHFEKQLYADPEQDLNRLWWQLAVKYQHLSKPPGRNFPDWAAKIHFTIAPCYYHNYLLGELFASQLRHSLTQQQIHNGKSLGAYLKKHIFKPGKRYPWNEMIRRATGEPLNPRYFIEEFIR